jgi:hypothetical protein
MSPSSAPWRSPRRSIRGDVHVVASKDEQMSGQLSSSKPVCIKKATITIEKNGVQVQQVESRGNGKWGPASAVGEGLPVIGDKYRIQISPPGGKNAHKCKLRNPITTFVLPAAEVSWASEEEGGQPRSEAGECRWDRRSLGPDFLLLVNLVSRARSCRCIRAPLRRGPEPR